VIPDELEIGGCTVRRVHNVSGLSWWHLIAYVRRDDTGDPVFVEAPINIRGTYAENGVGGRTWGFTDMGGGRWQVSPSINVVVNKDNTGHEVIAGPHTHRVSIWHQTPTVVGVPTGEPWQ
jgi:hypothetical protein